MRVSQAKLPTGSTDATSARIPSGVVTLGFVSLLMDVSTEMILSLLPVFLVSVLGASAATFGAIEGVAEATASITKLFSGAMSDFWGKRKPLLLAGYGLATLVRPIFPLAHTAAQIFAARLVDRIGKGIRGAPRDALVADITPPERRGAAYGLRQSLDSAGAFAGPLLALALMPLLANDMRRVFWFAGAPAVLCVLLIAIAVREPGVHHAPERRPVLVGAQLRALPGHFRFILALAGLFTLARFSEGFLLLRAQRAGLPVAWTPAVFVLMNLSYFLSAYPLGHLADRLDRRALIAAGAGVLVVADLVLAFAPSIAFVLLGALLWGLHMGATQGLLSAIVGDAAPASLRGTAFGLFNLVSGLALLAASVIAGALWTSIGSASTFLAGAAFAAASAIAIVLWGRPGVRSP
ncbi:MAG TPA: MFS transporter [Steroidobacteraceae bacterium]|nr:MFS transporter [Steroidobacteraceae bacterium]